MENSIEFSAYWAWNTEFSNFLVELLNLVVQCTIQFCVVSQFPHGIAGCIFVTINQKFKLKLLTQIAVEMPHFQAWYSISIFKLDFKPIIWINFRFIYHNKHLKSFNEKKDKTSFQKPNDSVSSLQSSQKLIHITLAVNFFAIRNINLFKSMSSWLEWRVKITHKKEIICEALTFLHWCLF